jgi:hypothetical protein
MTSVDAPTWIALGVGLYGAGLSTFTFVSNRLDAARAQARGIEVYSRMRVVPGDPPGPALAILAYNRERRPVQIVRAGIISESGMLVWHGPETPELPATLGDGESVEVRLPNDWIQLVTASTGGQISGFAVMDAGRTVYRSDPPAGDDT